MNRDLLEKPFTPEQIKRRSSDVTVSAKLKGDVL